MTTRTCRSISKAKVGQVTQRLLFLGYHRNDIIQPCKALHRQTDPERRAMQCHSHLWVSGGPNSSLQDDPIWIKASAGVWGTDHSLRTQQENSENGKIQCRSKHTQWLDESTILGMQFPLLPYQRQPGCKFPSNKQKIEALEIKLHSVIVMLCQFFLIILVSF